jgi:2-keto-4-pentenoate hydratase/2-oxohepta-3-ene-1,7-dioic acid hydratase in catechol pathway
MKICRFNDGTAGLVEGDRIYPIREALVAVGAVAPDAQMAAILAALSDHSRAAEALDRARKTSGVPLSEARLLPPIDTPPAIWAAAANYDSHQTEMKGRVGAYDRTQMSPDDLMAEIFLKPASSIIGPDDTIVLPKIARHVDFECELCAVIGRTARKVSAEQALGHVFGYLLCWDISVRDPWGRQRNTRNIRKGFDTFCGIGPWFVSKDEIAEPQDLHLHVEQNGQRVMVAHTADMINGLRDLIRFLSHVTTLRPGTLITTGTPAGVSQLAHGDLLRGTIEGVGTMQLHVVAEDRLVEAPGPARGEA